MLCAANCDDVVSEFQFCFQIKIVRKTAGTKFTNGAKTEKAYWQGEQI